MAEPFVKLMIEQSRVILGQKVYHSLLLDMTLNFILECCFHTAGESLKTAREVATTAYSFLEIVLVELVVEANDQVSGHTPYISSVCRSSAYELRECAQSSKLLYSYSVLITRVIIIRLSSPRSNDAFMFLWRARSACTRRADLIGEGLAVLADHMRATHDRQLRPWRIPFPI